MIQTNSLPMKRGYKSEVPYNYSMYGIFTYIWLGFVGLADLKAPENAAFFGGSIFRESLDTPPTHGILMAPSLGRQEPRKILVPSRLDSGGCITAGGMDDGDREHHGREENNKK